MRVLFGQTAVTKINYDRCFIIDQLANVISDRTVNSRAKM